tara:strand:+ start:760 stop:939 length:180 start_codon:yes stop_codon:yes gene_type:complete
MTNLYLDDKQQSHQLELDAISECCGAPTNSDIMICSACGEHCGIYYETDNQNNNLNLIK